MGGHGEASSSSQSGTSGVASGMRRRPIDPTRKLPLIRSTKELELNDDTRVDGEPVRPRPAHAPTILYPAQPLASPMFRPLTYLANR